MITASASTRMDPYYEEYFAMDPHGLDTSQLCYELSLRHMPTNGSARYRAIVVADQLRLEQLGQISRNHLQNSPYTVRHDLQECENLCRFLEGAAENRHIDSMALRTYLSKTIHLVMRIKRIRAVTQEQRALQRDIVRRMTMVRYEFRRQQDPDDVSLLLEGLTFNTSLPDCNDDAQPQQSNQIPTADQAGIGEAAAIVPEPNPFGEILTPPLIGQADPGPLATSSAKVTTTIVDSPTSTGRRIGKPSLLRPSLRNWRQPTTTPSPEAVDENLHSKDPASATNLINQAISRPIPGVARNPMISAPQFGRTTNNQRPANTQYWKIWTNYRDSWLQTKTFGNDHCNQPEAESIAIGAYHSQQ